MPQKSAICVKVSAVFSISHTAVAFGIKGSVMALYNLGARAAARDTVVRACRTDREAGHMDRGPLPGQGCKRHGHAEVT